MLRGHGGVRPTPAVACRASAREPHVPTSRRALRRESFSRASVRERNTRPTSVSTPRSAPGFIPGDEAVGTGWI